jgi:hypothetical protein
MHQSFQVGQRSTVLKDQASQSVAVDQAIIVKDPASEARQYGAVRGTVGLDCGMCHSVRIYTVGSKPHQETQSRALTTADGSGESDDDRPG